MTCSFVWDFSLLFYCFQLETLRNFLGLRPVALFAPAELLPREHRGYPQSRGFGGTNTNASLSASQREKGILARQTNLALSLLFPTRMLKMEYFGANFLGPYGERRTSFNFLRGFGNPLVDGNWGERPEVLMGKEEWIKIVKTGSKTLRTQGKTAWKMVVPGSKQNSVEGSAPGECCVPRGEEMVAMWL